MCFECGTQNVDVGGPAVDRFVRKRWECEGTYLVQRHVIDSAKLSVVEAVKDEASALINDKHKHVSEEGKAGQPVAGNAVIAYIKPDLATKSTQ